MKKLHEGAIAPDFSVTDAFGTSLSLQDFRGKFVLLSFFRYSGCPWCNLAILRLTQVYTQLQEKNLEVIAFVQSKKEDIIENIVDRHTPAPPFPLVPDPTMVVYHTYGVTKSILAAVRSITQLPDWVTSVAKHHFSQKKMDGAITLVPAQFIIDPDGIIIKAHYGIDYNNTLSFVEINKVLLFGTEKHIM